MSFVRGSNPRRVSRANLSGSVGGYGYFDPTGIANCVAWFDASDSASLFQSSAGTTAVTADNDPVGYITNKAAANHATQSTAASRALYKTNITNGKSALLFDGSDDFYALSSLQADNNGSMTVFFVGRLLPDQTLRGAILTERATARVASFAMYWETVGAGGKFIASDGQNASSNHQISNTVYANSHAWFVATYTHVVNSRMALRLNRNSVTVDSGTQSSLSGNAGARLGAREGNVGQHWAGYYGELIVYSRELSAAEIANVEHYLAYKWSVL